MLVNWILGPPALPYLVKEVLVVVLGVRVQVRRLKLLSSHKVSIVVLTLRWIIT
jgi:hypothetical protein